MISGVLSFGDYLAAQRLHQQPYLRRQVIILVVLALAGLLTVWAGYLYPGLVLFGAGTGGLIGLTFLHKFTAPGRHFRIYLQQASLRKNYTYSWDQTGIHIVWDTGQLDRP